MREQQEGFPNMGIPLFIFMIILKAIIKTTAKMTAKNFDNRPKMTNFAPQ